MQSILLITFNDVAEADSHIEHVGSFMKHSKNGDDSLIL